MDRQTDGQTDTFFATRPPCIQCSVVKTKFSNKIQKNGIKANVSKQIYLSLVIINVIIINNNQQGHL